VNKKVIIAIAVIIVLAVVCALAVIYAPNLTEILLRFHRIPQH